eukprot:1429072-Prymnesium_polylepis.1
MSRTQSSSHAEELGATEEGDGRQQNMWSVHHNAATRNRCTSYSSARTNRKRWTVAAAASEGSASSAMLSSTSIASPPPRAARAASTTAALVAPLATWWMGRRAASGAPCAVRKARIASVCRFLVTISQCPSCSLGGGRGSGKPEGEEHESG